MLCKKDSIRRVTFLYIIGGRVWGKTEKKGFCRFNQFHFQYIFRDQLISLTVIDSGIVHWCDTNIFRRPTSWFLYVLGENRVSSFWCMIRDSLWNQMGSSMMWPSWSPGDCFQLLWQIRGLCHLFSYINLLFSLSDPCRGSDLEHSSAKEPFSPGRAAAAVGPA